MDMVETQMKNISSTCTLPMGWFSSRTEGLKLDIYYISDSGRVVRLHGICHLPRLNQIWHSSITRNSVLYVSVALDIPYVRQTQVQRFTGTVPDEQDFGRSLTLWISANVNLIGFHDLEYTAHSKRDHAGKLWAYFLYCSSSYILTKSVPHWLQYILK